MSYSPPPADVSGYEPPASLWALVETNVPESERVELKRMMGESLVEQSLELHDEVTKCVLINDVIFCSLLL